MSTICISKFVCVLSTLTSIATLSLPFGPTAGISGFVMDQRISRINNVSHTMIPDTLEVNHQARARNTANASTHWHSIIETPCAKSPSVSFSRNHSLNYATTTPKNAGRIHSLFRVQRAGANHTTLTICADHVNLFHLNSACRLRTQCTGHTSTQDLENTHDELPNACIAENLL